MLITHISNNVLYKWWINTAKHYGSCHRISHMDHGPGTEILQFYDNIENAKKNIKHSNHFLMAWYKKQDDFISLIECKIDNNTLYINSIIENPQYLLKNEYYYPSILLKREIDIYGKNNKLYVNYSNIYINQPQYMLSWNYS